VRLVFRQLFDQSSSTYTYLLADPASRQAVLIDPVFEQVRRDSALISELGLVLVATLETHVHADHVTGAWLLRHKLGSQIELAASGGASGADRLLAHGDVVRFGSRHLTVRATPGHTNSCLTYVLDSERMAFTGDCLLIRGCGRTDFQQGDAAALYRSVKEQIFSLPDDCELWPGHDYQGRTETTVAEEKRLNPRLGGGRSLEDFVGYMKNLGLAHPKQIDVAVPANLRCGQPGADKPVPVEPSWAPLAYTFAGVWELEPHWLEEHSREVQIIDVRDADEFSGEMGHVPGSQLIPLDQLAERAPSLDRSRPVVAVCRSGGRSAQATIILSRAGFTDVANLAGGMLGWLAQGYPVENSASEQPA
jgi:sulfur dioxygenase